MANAEPLKRYVLIVNKLTTNQRPTLLQLQEFLQDHDIYVAERTLQRDLEALRNKFGIDIAYDSNARGYSVNLDQRFPLDNFLRVARLKLRSDLLATAIDDLQNNQDFISIPNNDKLKGLEYLESLLDAIRNKRIITFTYTKFSDSQSKEHVVKPYHLKEYEGRWYLLAMLSKGLTIYALDRLENLKISTEVFKRNSKIDPKSKFYDQLGISWGEKDKPSLIKLHFDLHQADYVRTLPWHDSQEIISSDKDGIVVTYYLVINYELIHQIVSIGEHVKVLAPPSLAEEVARIHHKAYSLYD